MANCKSCGKEIIWAKTPEGKNIPLDAVAPVYDITLRDGIARKVSGVHVSHFSTCRKANDFSASKKKPQGELPL